MGASSRAGRAARGPTSNMFEGGKEKAAPTPRLEAREGRAEAQVDLLPRVHRGRLVGVGRHQVVHRHADVARDERGEAGAENAQAGVRLGRERGGKARS